MLFKDLYYSLDPFKIIVGGNEDAEIIEWITNFDKGTYETFLRS